jgi:hypothetical protein
MNCELNIQVQLQETVHSKDCCHDRWTAPRDASCMKLDTLFAVHFITEACKLVILTAVNNFFAKCVLPAHHLYYSNYDSALKLTEDEESNWHSLQFLGVQMEDCMACDGVECGSGVEQARKAGRGKRQNGR